MKRKPRKVAQAVIMFFLRYGQLPPGIFLILEGLSRRPGDVMKFNFFVAEHCPELTRALTMLERSGIDSVFEPIPIGREHRPGSKNPIGSSGGDTVRDREYQ